MKLGGPGASQSGSMDVWAGLWPPEPPQSEHMFYRVSIIAKKGGFHNPSKAANFKAKIAASGNRSGSILSRSAAPAPYKTQLLRRVRSALRPHQKRWCVGKHNAPYKIQLSCRVRSTLRPLQKDGALENTTHPTKHNIPRRVRSALRPHQKNGALENTTHPTKYNLPRRVRSALRPHQKMVRWKTQRTLQNTPP